ncbi:unnamed protein product [Sphagnum balticum]
MMNLCSNSEEQSDPKLIEYRQVADKVREAGRCDRHEIGKLSGSKPTLSGDGNGYFTSPITSSDGKPSARARFAQPEQDLGSTALEISASRSGSALPRDKNSIDQAPAPSVTPKRQTKNSKGRGEARKSHSRSEGRTGESNSQRPLSSSIPEEEQAQLGQRLVKPRGNGEARKSQALGDDISPKVPLILSPFISESVTFSDAAKRGTGYTVPSTEAPEALEALEALGARNARKKQTAPLVRENPPTSLDALLGNGTGASSPSGEDTQGPSPVDYNREIKAEFPPTMVIELQRNVTLRARKTVIGRTLAGRASFKDLQDCLRLHLPAPFLTVTLLTRGYFEVLFEEEEGAKAARRLAAVEWSGWALSFSKYSALFRPNEHGAETFLTHSIKVQFPDLHVQLRTEKALTIMASSIGDVLDIESPDSYIKRPAGPMVTVEVKDISKLAGIIKIPSMAEGAEPEDTTA